MMSLTACGDTADDMVSDIDESSQTEGSTDGVGLASSLRVYGFIDGIYLKRAS